ncbi:MAG: SpoIID/LytB domain-containing protein [Planctomycetota bacterium]|nr:SpoIID/LytB domain-containing protein [Planctomycetota bacterium]
MRTYTRVLVWCCVTALLLCTGAACGGDGTPSLMANTAPPTIRVRLGKPRTKARLLIPRQAWTLRSEGGGAYAVRGASTLKTTLGVGARGIVVRGSDSGATVLRIRPGSWFTLDGKSYRGTLIVRRETDAQRGARLVLVNELDMETYVAGVIGNEVGPKAEPATYRAQAVTARTYAWMRLQREGAATRAFHVYDSQASQVYTGMTFPESYGIDYGAMVRRSAETRGVILTHRGRPFPAYYASTCGGHTTEPETSGLDPARAREPLRGVPCGYCGTSKYFRWDKTFSDGHLESALKRARRPISLPVHNVEIRRRGRGGWVAEVRIHYGKQKAVRTVPGHVFRSALGLRSHNFTSIRRVRGGWRVRGKGWGHGVGMCQWGAIEMGRKGATETEILRYYYPGVGFTKVY